jgi:predicted DNA-binding transcriptional regulator AlpA
MPKLLTLPEAAKLTRKSEAQMRWIRHNGTGPRSARISGRVMYREQDVIDWINAAFEAEESP